MTKVINADALGTTVRNDLRDWWREKKPQLGQALYESGLVLENHAARKAPVDTGRLKNSIHTVRVSDEEVLVQDAVTYGVFQEFGTARMSAQSFMRPAVYSSEFERQSIFREVLM